MLEMYTMVLTVYLLWHYRYRTVPNLQLARQVLYQVEFKLYHFKCECTERLGFLKFCT